MLQPHFCFASRMAIEVHSRGSFRETARWEEEKDLAFFSFQFASSLSIAQQCVFTMLGEFASEAEVESGVKSQPHGAPLKTLSQLPDVPPKSSGSQHQIRRGSSEILVSGW